MATVAVANPSAGPAQFAPQQTPMKPMQAPTGPSEAPQAEPQGEPARQPAGALEDAINAGMHPDLAAAMQAGQGGDHPDLAAAMQAGQAQKPQATERAPIGGMYGAVKLSDGSYGIKNDDGTVRPLSEHEKLAAHYGAKVFRTGGVMLGAGGAGAIGRTIGGPIVGLITSALGAVVGDAGMHQVASELERMAGEQPEKLTVGREATIAGGTLLGGLAGEGLSTLYASAGGAEGAAAGAATSGAGVAKTGTQALSAEAAESEAAIKQASVQNVPKGIPETRELNKGIVKQAENKIADIKATHEASTQTVAKKPLGEAVQEFREDLGKQVEPLAKKAADAARDRQFEQPAADTEKAFRSELGDYMDANGKIDYAKVPDAKKGIAVLWEKFQKARNPEVSAEGLGAKGGQPPMRVASGVGETNTSTTQVQPGLSGLQSKGPLTQQGVGEQSFATKHIQQGKEATPIAREGGNQIPQEEQVHVQEGLPLSVRRKLPENVEGPQQLVLEPSSRTTYPNGQAQQLEAELVNRGKATSRETSYPAKQTQGAFPLTSQSKEPIDFGQTVTEANQTQQALPLSTVQRNAGPNRMLPPNEAGPATRGMSLSEQNAWLDKIEKEANFQGANRNEGNYAAGRIYRALRLGRDDVSAQVLEEQGNAGAAKALRGTRDRFAKFSTDFDELGKQIDANQGEAAKTLAKKGDFKQATTLGSGLSQAHFNQLGSSIIDQVVGVLKEKGPAAAAKELDSWSPNVAKVYLTEGGYNAVKTQLNAATALQGKLGPSVETAGSGFEGLVRRYREAIHYPHYAAIKLAAQGADAMVPNATMRARVFGAAKEAATTPPATAAVGGALGSVLAPSSKEKR